jgi:hypothetical protein
LAGEALAEEALAFLLVAAIMVSDAQQNAINHSWAIFRNCTLFAPTALLRPEAVLH